MNFVIKSDALTFPIPDNVISLNETQSYFPLHAELLHLMNIFSFAFFLFQCIAPAGMSTADSSSLIRISFSKSLSNLTRSNLSK